MMNRVPDWPRREGQASRLALGVWDIARAFSFFRAGLARDRFLRRGPAGPATEIKTAGFATRGRVRDQARRVFPGLVKGSCGRRG